MKAKKPVVYVDGQEGTTGLRVAKRLSKREDISLLQIDSALRKDVCERKKLMNQADVVILCLPDEAAREAVVLIENEQTKVIDTSCAHRTKWTYGFPEGNARQREKIKISRRVSNPGCHALNFIAGVQPLLVKKVITPEVALNCFSLTGYSGGGKKMIQKYEAERAVELEFPGIYGISQQHKHLPEMMKFTGLKVPPTFCPIVNPFYSGMATCLLLHKQQLCRQVSLSEIRQVFDEFYQRERLIQVVEEEFSPGATLYANRKMNTDGLEILISGNEERLMITVFSDNLGKGSSGNVLQTMNLMLGLEEFHSLVE